MKNYSCIISSLVHPRFPFPISKFGLDFVPSVLVGYKRMEWKGMEGQGTDCGDLNGGWVVCKTG